MVVVEPESSKTFNKILDFTEAIVSTTMIVTGVRYLWVSLLALMPIAFLALHFPKLVYTSSVRIYCSLLMLLGAFPVEFSVEIVLQESVFLKLDNCLLISNSFA